MINQVILRRVMFQTIYLLPYGLFHFAYDEAYNEANLNVGTFVNLNQFSQKNREIRVHLTPSDNEGSNFLKEIMACDLMDLEKIRWLP